MPQTIAEKTSRVKARISESAIVAPIDANFIKNFRLKTLPGTSRDEMGRLLKVSGQTVYRWESGKSFPDENSQERIRRLNRVCMMFSRIRPSNLLEWIERPHPALDNFRPSDMLDSEYGMRKLEELIQEVGQEAGW